jgi:hypothetical protein
MPALLDVVLPVYDAPRTFWGEQIHAAIVAALPAPDASYSPDDRLAIDVEIHMTASMLRFHDVDNRLKDVLDALQGRAGGTKAKRGRLRALVPNDWQVFPLDVREVRTIGCRSARRRNSAVARRQQCGSRMT